MKYFILNGPSAAGKTLLLDFLLHNNDDFLEPIKSFTTRRARTGERHGKEYYFISTDQYLALQKADQIIEQINYLGNIYGVTRDELKRVEKTGKNGIAIMTSEGIRLLKQNVGYQKLVSIFIYRDLTTILKTINEIHTDSTKASQRFEMAKREMRDITSCDHVVYNISSITDASQQLIDIIKKEINSKALEREIKPGQRYKHFKGEIFEVVLDLVENTETLSPMVVYRNIKTNQLYARPYELFCGKKEWPYDVNGIVNRFELIE
ncbi:MAG: DUF1653 domain-containing protein [Syntrophomonas sp.]|nr:DUF1653 domain-containing protein [Syntrophomonas sp.]